MIFDHQIYGVCGSPILHSKSPLIFNCIFDENMVDATYIRIAAETAKESIQIFKNLGMLGMNITAPFKTDIITELDSLDEHAKRINAVNTIVKRNNKLIGYNTDYIGVYESLKKYVSNISGKRCLVIGSGGAGRAATYGLLINGAEVTIVNRTLGNAKKTATDLSCSYASIEDISDISAKSDIIVNSTSNNELHENLQIDKAQIVLSAHYSIMQKANSNEENRFNYIKGEDWLLHQAVPTYQIFTGKEVDYKSLHNCLEKGNSKLSSHTNISLIGFMGSGKTTVGKLLSEKMEMEFFDIDEMIEEKENMEISRIFIEKGEKYFRGIEKELLFSLRKQKDSIISCGGGIIWDDENRELLKKISNVFWLYSSPEVCLERINDGTRPLLVKSFNRHKNPEQFARELFSFRLPYYCEIADVLINSEQEATLITDKINEELYKTINS